MNRPVSARVVCAGSLLAILLFAALLTGCASTSVGAQIVLPPTTIIGDPDGHRGDVYDAYDLFERADRAFVEQTWDKVAALYEKLLAEYPAAEVAPLARYNLGLVRERQKQWADALAVYDGFPQPPGKGVRIEEVRLRRGVCLGRLDRHREAMAEYEKILRQFGVPPLEFNEARARLGIAAYYAGDDVLAEHYLNLAVAAYEKNAHRGVVYARATMAEAYFLLGEMAAQRFKALPLAEAAPAELGSALRVKARALIEARRLYTLAVRTYEPEWVVASLFRVGEAYETFYRQVMAVPAPEELDAEAAARYRQTLATKLQPVRNKAIMAYRRNLELAVDLRVDNRWVEKTRERVRALTRPPAAGDEHG